MEAYASFARVYDMFMDNIPYEEWCGYLSGLLAEYGIHGGLVLDLGCGTGTMTELFGPEGLRHDWLRQLTGDVRNRPGEAG